MGLRVSPEMSGSTRGIRGIRVPSAFEARTLMTSLEESANDFAKVRCSCGRNGFKNVGIFSSKLFRVNKIAAAFQIR